MAIYYELDNKAKLTDKEKKEIETAKKMPIVFDEDSPELTEEMRQAFIEARRKKPFKGQMITILVSGETLKKAENAFGDSYLPELGKILDKAVKDYVV